MAEKRLKDTVVKNLYSNNDTTILQALETITESGNSNYIPLLIDIMSTTKNTLIQQEITKILSEVKHTDAVPELIKGIENVKYLNIQETLIRVCWENGLDFSNYFSTFVDLLIKGDYMTAFEAYTVIESSEGTISQASANELIQQLESALISADKERKVLIQAIISFLPEIVKS